MPRVYTKKTHCIWGHELIPENRVNGTGQCRECRRINMNSFKIKNPDYKKNWRLENKESGRIEHIGPRYGISHEQYQEMISTQNNQCCLCRVYFEGDIIPHVDHDHRTEKVRGLLCRACNSGLGQFRDNPEVLKAVIVYLEKERP